MDKEMYWCFLYKVLFKVWFWNCAETLNIVETVFLLIFLTEKPEKIADISASDITPTRFTIIWSPAFDGYDTISTTIIKVMSNFSLMALILHPNTLKAQEIIRE